MTTNASGSDSLIGIDDILVTSSAIGNTAPTIVGLNPAQMYGEQSPAFIIDSDVTVADAELDALNGGLGNYNGASIQIADAALSATNVFDFGMSFVQRVGNELQIMGGTIAVLSFGPGYIGINFTDIDFITPTTAIVNEVLQKLTYANTSGNPPASVTLNYVITDVGALTGGDSIQIFMSASPDAPTDIGLSSTTVQEFRANGTVVATLSTADEDGSSNTYTYTLLNSAGGRFTIVGNQLRVANGLLFDFEQATSHNITVRTSDGTTTFDKGFAITVGNVDPETIVGDGAANTLVGGAGADNFQGGGGIDILRGNANNDQLNGGIGNDTMEGGLGNDIYTVDISTDLVVEAGVGTDLVNSSAANFTLGANVENLTLTGVGNINGTGNTLANVLTGNAGVNVLDGKGGVDTLIGLGGDDIYVVDSATDQVMESAASAPICVNSSAANFTLGANVENLTLTGVGNINGTGNTLANVITGNAGNKRINGGLRQRHHERRPRQRHYTVDSATDQVNEAGAGTDLVNSSVTFTLGANVENLTLTGVGNIDGTGNTLANVITGNAGSERAQRQRAVSTS